ncbi:hypothetical protein BSKO_05036 [Bryopsis sp. KO-2023]|nr:hypothetical protein BSKO_05036 [Bryopsis sp. KO-2023]
MSRSACGCEAWSTLPAVHTRRLTPSYAAPGRSSRGKCLAAPTRVSRGSAFRRSCSASDDAAPSGASGSSDTAVLQEMAQLDMLIDLLLECSSPEELARAVGENILALDQKFWLRLATRADSAGSKADKDRLMSLSRAVMSLVDAMVKRADAQLTDSSQVLGEILKAGADETGNWNLPLGEKEINALNQALEDNKEHINEALLSNAFAWMRKASDDKLDGMVVLLQKVLQLYAARELKTGVTDGLEGFLNDLFVLDAEEWEEKILDKAKSGEVTEEEFNKAVQMKLENTILLPSGSNGQRVQVEYLSELKNRGKSAFEKSAASSA